MRARPWQRMVKAEILPRVPELVLTGSLLHRPDVEWMFCGALKNDSSYSSDFSVEVVVIPLYAPRAHLGWQVGTPLDQLAGRRGGWRPDEQTEAEMGQDIADRLRRGALPFWQANGDLRAFAAECRRRTTYRIDVNLLEAVAGAGVILGDESMARDAFSAVRTDVTDRRDWAIETADRIRELEREWSQGSGQALDLLRQRRDYTASHAGLA